MAIVSVILMAVGAGFIAGANSCLTTAAWGEMTAPVYAMVSATAWTTKLIGYTMVSTGGFLFVSSIIKGRTHGDLV